MRKVLITTLGCKVNQFESESFTSGLLEAGARLAKRGETADLIIVNTCAVTGTAGAQSRQTIRKLARKNPAAAIIVTGCYAEIDGEQLAADPALAGRRLHIVGNAQKDQLVSLALGETAGGSLFTPGEIARARDICRLPVDRFANRSRAYLRIQDGCESFCSYCIVPYTRGPSRSLPPAEVLAQAQLFSEAGHRELILTGIHLGNYGRDLKQRLSFTQLLDLLSQSFPECCFRISSLEPLEIDRQLLAMMADRDNIQPHLHIPLQSGHDHILAKMNRRYTTEQFRQVITECRAALPDAALGLDILVGFPGESEQIFAQSLQFVASLDCTYLHVFPYSIRPGTPAAKFGQQVSAGEKEERSQRLRRLGDEKRLSFWQGQLGRTTRALIERRKRGDQLLRGTTGNYLPIKLAGPDSLAGQNVTVSLDRLEADCFIASVVEHP